MRKLFVLVFIVALSGSLATGCAEIAFDDLETAEQPTIFGSFDIHQIDGSTSGAAAQVYNATVALFEGTDMLTYSGDQVIIAADPTLDQDLGVPVCSRDRMHDFHNESAHGFCSGFMVGSDLIATAAHCLRNQGQCGKTTFVFNYSVANAEPDGDIVVDVDDVYSCSEVVAYGYHGWDDWSLVRVDRPIGNGHEAITMRSSGYIEDDVNEGIVDSVMIVGHPWGIPVKYADNAQVFLGEAYAYEDEYFVANIDHFAGNSGSIVVSLSDNDLVLGEGVFVRAYGDDWVLDIEGGQYCYASGYCDEDGCYDPGTSGEVSRATQFAAYLPGDSVCGDGSCNGDETCSDCPEDCGPCPECPDGECNGDETCESCPVDCGACPECLPRGEPCTTGDECCSGRCHHRKGTCQ